MKRKQPTVPAFVRRVKNGLTEGLARVGIPAEVEFEKVGSTRLFRFTTLAPKFAQLRHGERQDLVWRIVDSVLDKESQLQISMIVTLTPSELGEAA
ncbi:MAG: hypothetical protein WEC33_05330 [Dehalococcoidia bacterium]